MDRSPNDGTLKHHELTEIIIGTFYEVYNELGFGFLEPVYENSLVSALRAKGLHVRQQAPVEVWFRGKIVGEFKADVVVEEKVILELKSVRIFDESHKTQLLNYLRATEIEVGLLLNFGHRAEFKRMAFDNKRKRAQPGNDGLLSSLFSED